MGTRWAQAREGFVLASSFLFSQKHHFSFPLLFLSHFHSDLLLCLHCVCQLMVFPEVVHHTALWQSLSSDIDLRLNSDSATS